MLRNYKTDVFVSAATGEGSAAEPLDCKLCKL